MARSAITCEHCGRQGVPRLVNGAEVCGGCGRDVDRPVPKEDWVSAEEELAPAVLDALNALRGPRMITADVCRALGRPTYNRTVRRALDRLAEQGVISRDSRKRWGRVAGTKSPGKPGTAARTHARAHSGEATAS